jgi:hypothetical protein
MVSGDMALQIEIFIDVRNAVVKKIEENPKEWVSVKWVADEYARVYAQIRTQRAARDILSPLGLTNDSFISRQKEMAPELVKQLASEMIRFEMPEADVIIAGVDSTGSHLYVGKDGAMTCEDGIGFCAIGAGAQHAESLLMGSSYVKTDSIPRGLYLAYAAKKRAEIAPGVGVATDMFTIGPKPGSHSIIGQEMVDGIDNIFQRSMEQLREVANGAETAAHGYVEALVSASTSAAAATAKEGQASIPETPGGTPSADNAGPRGEPIAETKPAESAKPKKRRKK